MRDEDVRRKERHSSLLDRIAIRSRTGQISDASIVMAARLGSPEAQQFMSHLHEPPIDWKRWGHRTLAIKSLGTRERMVAWACDIVERMLPRYEASFPDDRRSRVCLETTRAFLRGEATEEQLQQAQRGAYAAYRNGYTLADAYGARAASITACAAIAPAYTVDCISTAAAAGCGEAEFEWRKQRLIEYLLGEVQ